MTELITKELVMKIISSASIVEVDSNHRYFDYTCDGEKYTVYVILSHHKRAINDTDYVIVGHNTLTVAGLFSLDYYVEYCLGPPSDDRFKVKSYKIVTNNLVSDKELEHHVMLIKLQLPNK